MVEAWRGRSRSGRGRRPALPRGTVTFLFTDIEGSTRLVQRYGRLYAELLADHRRRLRAAIAAHAGAKTDTIGDALFAAFPHAPHAVAAAVDAQAALAAGPVRVRIGLHTGNPLLTEEGYVGLDVHRAARITAAGHAGQILLSQPTRDLVDVSVRPTARDHAAAGATSATSAALVRRREPGDLCEFKQRGLPHLLWGPAVRTVTIPAGFHGSREGLTQ